MFDQFCQWRPVIEPQLLIFCLEDNVHYFSQDDILRTRRCPNVGTNSQSNHLQWLLRTKNMALFEAVVINKRFTNIHCTTII